MLTFDMRAFEEAARSMKAAQDQVQFAISQALNKAAQVTGPTGLRDMGPPR
jgi:hypothetical protein